MPIEHQSQDIGFQGKRKYPIFIKQIVQISECQFWQKEIDYILMGFFLDIDNRKGFICNGCYIQSFLSVEGNLINLICDFVVMITNKIHTSMNGIEQKLKHCL